MSKTYQYPRITISGARGIVGDDLTVENVQRMAWAYARMIGGGKVVLARDSRVTGDMILSSVCSGLLAGGADVVIIGMVPTPTVGIMIRKLGAKGGINITASHNPQPWNALKMFSDQGTFPDDSFVNRYIEFLNAGEFEHARWDDIKPIQQENSSLQTHSDFIEEAIDCDPIREKKFKVVVDGCRSVGGLFLPPFLDSLDCDVFCLDCQSDGAFTRGLEPTPDNLAVLCEKVRDHKADIGIAADPDADRLAIVSEEGIAIGEEFTLAFATDAALKLCGAGKVVTNLSTSLLTDFAAKKHGGSVIRTAIGEANVAHHNLKHNAIIGGEGNGGVMFPKVHNGRDSLTAAALVLLLMAQTGKKVSELVAEYPDYVILKEKVTLDLDVARERLETIAKADHDGQVDTQDGVKIIYDNAWLHLRCSNTEPIVRIIAEAEGKEETQRLMVKGRELLGLDS